MACLPSDACQSAAIYFYEALLSDKTAHTYLPGPSSITLSALSSSMLPSTLRAHHTQPITQHAAMPVCNARTVSQSAPQSTEIARMSPVPQQAHNEQWHHQQIPQHMRTRRDRLSCQVTVSNRDASTLGQAQPAASIPTPAKQAVAQDSLITFPEVHQIAEARGLHMSLKTLGPFYRIVCRDGSAEGQVLGITAGFTAPAFGLMHCDTLQVFTKGMKGEEADRIRRSPLGLGLLLGGAVFSYGRQCGCRKAEILAINDDDAWHERLVRYYSYFGFKPVHKVGGRGFFTDLPHLLVWGGEGTRMDADINSTLARWTPALRQSGRKQSLDLAGGGG